MGGMGNDVFVDYLNEQRELVDLIEDALSGLAHSECPNCQTYIGLDRYIDRSDIENWLRERKKVKK